MKLFIAIFLATAVGANTSAQTTKESAKQKTETIKVLGNCDMCKTRIEQVALDEGASNAEWNSQTKLLTVVYDPSETNTNNLERKIATAGHDTENHKAANKVYDALPGCCKYNRSMVSYSCTMHPEVSSDKPGKCSRCGMALTKLKTEMHDADKHHHGPEQMHKN